MTTDLEQRIRRTLDEDAGKAPRVARPPAGLRRRVRRRQSGTAASAVAGLAAVVALTVVAVQAFPGDDRFVPQPSDASTRPVYERTATIEGFSVTAPSDWFLVDHWTGSQRLLDDFETGERRTLPVLEVTNFDPGLGRAVCDVPAGSGNPLPPGGVVVFVALADDDLSWDGSEECGGGPSGPVGSGSGLRRTGTVDDNDQYVAWLITAEGVSESDVAYQHAYRIWESVQTRVEWMPPSPPPIDTPGYVLWGGTNDDGSTWTIEARPSDRNVELTVLQRSTDGTYTQTGLGDFAVPPREIDGTYVGVVDEEADRVEFRFDDGREPLVASIADLPASLGYAADAFTFLPASEDWNAGRAVAVMPEPTEAPPLEPATPVTTSGLVVAGEGVSDDRRFKVEMSITQLPDGPVVMAELWARPTEGPGTWQRLQTAAFDPDEVLAFETFSFPWNGTSMPFVTYGIASDQVAEVRADLENGGFRIPGYELTAYPLRPGDDGDAVTYAWVRLDHDPAPGTITAVGADTSETETDPFEPAPEGAELSSGDAGVTMFLDTEGTYDWRANMTWSNEGVLGDVTVQATPHGSGERPDRWAGTSQTLSLAEGFSALAVTMPGREDDGCLRTVIVGVFDPARVSSVQLDGGTLTLTTKDLGSVNLDHTGTTIFSATACDVDGTSRVLTAIGPSGEPVVTRNLLPAQLPRS